MHFIPPVYHRIYSRSILRDRGAARKGWEEDTAGKREEDAAGEREEDAAGEREGGDASGRREEGDAGGRREGGTAGGIEGGAAGERIILRA